MHIQVIGGGEGYYKVGNGKDLWRDLPYPIDTAIDAIEIGGRNLLLGSANPLYMFSWNSANGSATKTEETMLGTKGILLDVTAASTGWQFCSYNFGPSRMELIKPDTYYTLSFDVYPSTDNEIDFFIANNDTANIVSSFSVNKKIVANQWNHISLTLKTHSTITISNQVIYIRGFNKVATYKICNFKLEEGNKATPWTPAIEDTEAEIRAVDKKLTTNLLKPTLATTTQNGVTCTNNGDGTYTLNGTATADATFLVGTIRNMTNTELRMCGCPSGGSENKYYLIAFGALKDTGSGTTYGLWLDESPINIRVMSGVSVSNLLFKPMITTTNLNATYDDFVPYTGSTGQINSDVAEVRKDFDEHTHNYAGSSSSGGSATSAVKLDSSAGSAKQPVYFSDGKPVACNFIYEEGVFTPTFWSDSFDEQTFEIYMYAYYKRIGNLCYIHICAYSPSAVDVSYIDNLPFVPDSTIHNKNRPVYLSGTVFSDGVGCVVNPPVPHVQISLPRAATGELLVEGIYNI